MANNYEEIRKSEKKGDAEDIPLATLRKKILDVDKTKREFRITRNIYFGSLSSKEFVLFKNNKEELYEGKLWMKVCYHAFLLKLYLKLFFLSIYFHILSALELTNKSRDIPEEIGRIREKLYGDVAEPDLKSYFSKFVDKIQSSKSSIHKAGEHTGQTNSNIDNIYVMSNYLKWKSGNPVTNKSGKSVSGHLNTKDNKNEEANSKKDSEGSDGGSDESASGVDSGSGGESESRSGDD